MSSASSLADVAQDSELNVEERVFSEKKYPIGDDIEMGKESTGVSRGPVRLTCAPLDFEIRSYERNFQDQNNTILLAPKVHDQVMAERMNPETYIAVTSGDMTYFEKAIEDQQFRWGQASPRGNTILHIAASFGDDELVKLILQKSGQQFIYRKNRTGDIPLHVAASAGHLSIVEIFLHNIAENPKSEKEQLSRVKNNEENTPLHVALKQLLRVTNSEEKYLLTKKNVALKNRYEKVARALFVADPEASYTLNEEGKSPLYLAAEAGYVELVRIMMEKSATIDISEKKEKSIVHAAITSKNIDVLRTILTMSNEYMRDELLKKVDDKGLTPLSYAAFTGHLDGVRYILQGLPKCAYINNTNGTFPIHMASNKGYIKIIEDFLKCCPDSGEMLTKDDDWNILHVAAENGKARAVRHMLKMPKLEMLINETDTSGNTPLHLASKRGHPKVVSILTWDKRVDLNLLNCEGKTALDIATNFSGKTTSFRERLTWLALRYAGALHADKLPSIVRVKPQTLHQPEEPLRKPQSLDHQLEELLSKPQSLDQSRKPRSMPQSSETGEPPNKDNDTDRVNTLLLVATLITTVTFTAGFTMPGGYCSSEPHQGMATFVRRPMFHAFIISNTIAMYSSLTVVVGLIWAYLGDLNLVIASLKVTVPLLGLALTMVSVAFMTGIYLVVSSLNWLANIVLVMGSISLLFLLVLFVPLCIPSSVHHITILRYIFYYPFCLLIIVTRSDIDKKGERRVCCFRCLNKL